jgi:two-component system nitrogen regulation sensor histidine kinase GlnL
MGRGVLPLIRPRTAAVSSDAVLESLGLPIIVVGPDGAVRHANPAAEGLFASSAKAMAREGLAALLPADNPLFALIDQVRAARAAVNEYGVVLESPRIPKRRVDVLAAPMMESGDPPSVVVSFKERTIAEQIERQLSHKGAARSVTAMAAMLAHEVRNPLSGIRGAAQLLEQNAADEDRDLAALIRDEADRISGLVARMDAFADTSPPVRGPVNIHEVLDRVRRLATTGFAQHVRFQSLFDPSLPPVYADRDQLIQVFLNLVKNASESVPREGGEIQLKTAYRHGVRFAVSGSDRRVHLPLEIVVQDNGPGIDDDILPYLFDAFVTTKTNGSGLGLALVAKIVDDHGGVIECEGARGRTAFRVMLPTAPQGEDAV